MKVRTQEKTCITCVMNAAMAVIVVVAVDVVYKLIITWRDINSTAFDRVILPENKQQLNNNNLIMFHYGLFCFITNIISKSGN